MVVLVVSGLLVVVVTGGFALYVAGSISQRPTLVWVVRTEGKVRHREMSSFPFCKYLAHLK